MTPVLPTTALVTSGEAGYTSVSLLLGRVTRDYVCAEPIHEVHPMNNRREQLVQWVLLKMSRRLLAGVIIFAVFMALLAANRFLTPLPAIVRAQAGLADLFPAFIGTIVTGTSIVVTINQLVLAQELGAFGDQRERMEASMTARREIEEEMGVDTSPAEPAAFVRSLAAALESAADDLDNALDAQDDEHTQLCAYADGIRTEAQQLQTNLVGAEFGTFEVLQWALAFNYSEQIHAGRQLRAARSEANDEVADCLDSVLDLLTSFAPVREHFKTLYFQWEFINLSRALLYISIPALTVIGMLVMFVDASTFTGMILGLDTLVAVTCSGFVVGISPFVVFLAYILRIATVAKQTLAIGPFVLEESERGSTAPSDQ